MSIAVGVDIGGTKTAIGLIDETGMIIAKETIRTELGVTPKEMTGRIADTIQSLIYHHAIESDRIKGIGIGAPGPLDPNNGKIICPPNLPGWEQFPVVEEMQRYFGLTIRMENDATAAALAEKWIGAARENDHFVFVTISTGIGAGIYSQGKLITGASGNAGDAGHMVIDPSAGKCVCGQYGCWEWVASGTAIARQAAEILQREVSSKEVFELASQGDTRMSELTERLYRYIGMGCVSLINLCDPEKVVIGGGVSQAGAPLFTAVQEYVSRFALNPSGKYTEVVPAKLQTNAGLIGAASLIHIHNYIDSRN